MSIGYVIELLAAYKRYVDHMNNNGYDEVIDSIKENQNSLLITMKGHMGETYEMEIYFSDTTGELCIEETETHENILNVIDLEACNLTEEDINYFKYGRR